MELQQDWWLHPLAKEIHKTLRSQEQQLPVYLGHSPQLDMRRYLVDWLASICDKFKLCRTARHLTVLLLDHMMDHFDVDTDQLRLVSLGCLLVATKFEEREVQIPRSAELNNMVPCPGHTAAEYLQMELIVLDFLKWNVGMPTTAHFLDYYLEAGMSGLDFRGTQSMVGARSEKSHCYKYLQKYTNYFAEVSLQDRQYRDYKPSVISAACVAAARHCLNISPNWSVTLQMLTGYNMVHLNPVLQSLLKTHQMDNSAIIRRQMTMIPFQSSPKISRRKCELERHSSSTLISSSHKMDVDQEFQPTQAKLRRTGSLSQVQSSFPPVFTKADQHIMSSTQAPWSTCHLGNQKAADLQVPFSSSFQSSSSESLQFLSRFNSDSGCSNHQQQLLIVDPALLSSAGAPCVSMTTQSSVLVQSKSLASALLPDQTAMPCFSMLNNGINMSAMARIC